VSSAVQDPGACCNAGFRIDRLASGVAALRAQKSTPAAPVIPKTWDDEAIATLEIPLADPVGSPKHVSSEYYYRIPVVPIYKSYPVYVGSRLFQPAW
jgi:hypothetical protein